jgi:hypothetical protein
MLLLQRPLRGLLGGAPGGLISTSTSRTPTLPLRLFTSSWLTTGGMGS